MLDWLHYDDIFPVGAGYLIILFLLAAVFSEKIPFAEILAII